MTGVGVGTSRLAVTDGTSGDADVVFWPETVELVEAAIFIIVVKVQRSK